MNWDAPHLVAVAAAPGALLLAFSTAVAWMQKKIGALSAVGLSLGLALTAGLLISLAVHTTGPLYEFRGSLPALLGVPVLVYASVLIVLARRWRINKAGLLLLGTLGLVGLFYLGRFVLLSSACGISLGGC